MTSHALDVEPAQSARPELPEPGRVVEVRGATWAVTDVVEQGLPRSPADESKAESQHVVSLQSLEEDRLGEDLQVVWELEIGHTVVPEQGLPKVIHAESFDDPNQLGAFIDAVRWGAVTSADAKAFQSPFRSGANLEPHQLEPLRRALESPRTNLLLADDVGLGKTIEAGLVIQELLLRHRARSVIVVCPPSLSLKWQDEMREKFGLDFVIVDSERMAQSRRTFGLAANPFRLFPRVIVSMAWLPSTRAQRLLREVLSSSGQADSGRRYAFDVLVVDEAHHVAPSAPTALGASRGYAVDSKRTLAVRELAAHCEHRLFLSATPHNGYSESFTALLEMIDSRRFSRGADIDQRALGEVAVRRLKVQIKDLGFKPRVIKTILFTAEQQEEEMFDLLDKSLKASAADEGKKSLDIAGLLLKKRFLSSPWAFSRTLAAYTASAPLSGWAEDDDYYAEVMGSGQSDEEEGLFTQPEFETLRQAKRDDPLAAARRKDVDRLIAWGQGHEHRPDSRLTALLTTLNAICRPDGQRWSNERVVVFTEYADTLTWIVDVLEQQGYGDHLEVIQGSTPPEEREMIRARFTADPVEDPVRVLVATDAAGEGIDLQDYCHRLVNFDVPFNPSRLEQRIGRIDRYGQREAPEVFYFAPDSKGSLYAGDTAFLRRIGRKMATEADDLGVVNPLIDDKISQHFLGPRNERRQSKAQAATNEAINQVLAGGVELNRQLTELGRTYDDRKEAMHLTPASSRRVVDTALRIANEPTLMETGHQDTDAEVFEVPPALRRSNSWRATLAGVATRLKPDQLRPITFDQAAGQKPDLVYVHLGHALMQKAARTLRASLFGSDSKVNRVTAVVVPDLNESCVAALSRLVLVGRGGLRLHEEVFVTGIRFRGHDLAEEKVQDLLDRALDPGRLTLASLAVRRHLEADWQADGGRARKRLRRAMARRAETRQAGVRDSLEKRQAADVERAEEIFKAFRLNLSESLRRLRGEEEEQQAMLFSDDQRRQRLHDIRQMEDRLLSLDDEERREIAGIRDRYADVKPYVSAVALVFAVTASDAAAWEATR
ncbi:MAG: DISARM system SNF2-like helicase DrmD [Propionibacteriaceae bacterium]|jgi:superfamily II DNA or RNA helicase|nr:DISARM system SNF2-like helicase DrmD [Propionibacteriaceae bacterium]